jgi:pimeloyl-ACP methyl ester carboxylesterase
LLGLFARKRQRKIRRRARASTKDVEPQAAPHSMIKGAILLSLWHPQAPPLVLKSTVRRSFSVNPETRPWSKRKSQRGLAKAREGTTDMQGRERADTIPGAKLSVYEGVGHAPFWEDAERFNIELAAFVRMANKRGPLTRTAKPPLPP